MTIIVDLGIVLMAYLLGSVPFGLVLTKYKGMGDIRHIGSGNIGATNVLRTGNKSLALCTLICDALKGAVAVWIAKALSSDMVPVYAGVAAVLGHIFPIWLQFKGGKGVATTLAVVAALWWPLALTACATWLTVFFTFKISSFAALITFLVIPVCALFFIGFQAFLMTCILSGVVIYRHKDNILRLLKGEEQGFAKAKR